MRIAERLAALRDDDYAAFQRRLIPNIPPESITGVRMPRIRALARELDAEEAAAFMDELPHEHLEENLLHAVLIAQLRDERLCRERLEAFLPHVDNWAVCDCIRPGALLADKAELLCLIRKWIVSPHCYTSRFAMEMLMLYFLEEDFDPSYPSMVAQVSTEEYYLRMMQAWYFATALSKQYEAVIPYIEKGLLHPWVHSKTIQKACESFRISGERKQYLRTLK